jgi:hypothetical protein
MSHHDAIRDEAERRLRRQADMTAYTARRFSEAARQGDLDAARRWRREYQLSAACCRALGRRARGQPAAPGPTRPVGGKVVYEWTQPPIARPSRATRQSGSGAAAPRSPLISPARATREWTPSFS